MDQITKLYYYKALQLQEQVAQLEKKLQLLSEEPTTAPKYGRGKRSGLVGGSPTAQGDEDVDFTGGNVDKKSGAWTPSSGGPAVADSEAGDIEIENRMRGIARGGGLFGKGVEQTEQTPAYMEMKGELERRKAAREAAKKGGGQQKPQATQPTDGAGTKGGAGAISSGEASGTEVPSGSVPKQSMTQPKNEKIDLPEPKGPVDTGRQRPQPASQPTVPTGKAEGDSGVDPKLVVLGLAGAGLAGKAIYDRYARQRGKSLKPGEAAKPTPKAPEATKTQAGKTPVTKALNSRAAGTPMTGTISEKPLPPETTIGGKPVAKGKGTVADRAAVGRDLLRARAEAAKAVADAKEKAVAPQKPTAGTAQPAQTAKPTATPKSVSTGSQVTNVAKGLGKGVGSFGAGLGGYFIGRSLSDAALGAAGVEDGVAKDITGEAIGGAAGGVAGAAAGTALKGGGLIGLKAAGAAAGTGALAGLAAYGGYKAGEAISNIEVDEKGTTVSDVAGKGIYDIYGKMTGKGTSSQQLNTKPTGVAGGDPNKMAQNAAEEAEEEKQKKAEMEERIARAASKRKSM